MSMKPAKCLDPDCDYSGSIESYHQEKNPLPGRTGYWCPKCGYSVILTKDGNGIDHFMDDETFQLGLKLLGKIDIDSSKLN